VFNQRLNKIREHVEDWCQRHDISTSTVCDTIGIQGVKIYERNKKALHELFEGLSPILNSDNVYLDIQRVRGGLLLAFSAKALTESEIQQLLTDIGETSEAMTFSERISDAFVGPIKPIKENAAPQSPKKLNFDNLAKRIAEDSFKDATEGATRSNQTSRQRNNRSLEMTYAGVHPKHHKRSKEKTKNTTESVGPRPFMHNLAEALEGMATPDGQQPGDLFKKFAKALSVLGQQMGIGPLQDQLKKQGINYKKSDDGQAILLYIQNAQTNAPQPIARISAETLSKPNEFQDQLLNMIDFSQGKAPGAFKQKQEELREQEKTVRDIAQAVNPDNDIAGKMSGDTAATTAAATTAATTAASPKPVADASKQITQQPTRPTQPVRPAQPQPQSQEQPQITGM
jgi:hypothetical protein